MPGVAHAFVDAGGLQTHVAEIGDGPPLVLLHGWPQHWWMWRELMPSLARRFRVIAPDLRGFGWTDAPSGGYRKEEMAGDVLALLDALGLERVRLMGHDWGAVIAQILAVTAPERLERVISLSVPPLDGARPRPDPRAIGGFAHVPVLASPAGPLVAARLARVLLQLGRAAGRYTEEELDTYTAVYAAPARRWAAHRCYRAFALHEVPQQLTGRWRGREPGVPLKLLGGERDPVVRAARDVERVRGAGHFLPEEKPDAVLGHALAFF